MFKLKKRVPLTVRIYRGRPPVYPWADMKPGDSFTVPYEDRFKIRSAASRVGKRRGMLFETRGEGNNIRVWRTE